MRKKNLAIIILLCSLSMYAQNAVLNPGFETLNEGKAASWSVKDDFGWSIVSESASGNNAFKISNWYYYIKSELINGVYDFNSGQFGGTPISFRPNKLKFAYKYILGENSGNLDSGIVEVEILKFKPEINDRLVLGSGKLKLGAISEFTTKEVIINYDDDYISLVPDSILIKFRSSENGFCDANESDGYCCSLFIDDIETVASISTAIMNSKLDEDSLQLNVSEDYINVINNSNSSSYSLKIFTPTGVLIYDESNIKHKVLTIGTQNWQRGFYFFDLVFDRPSRSVKRMFKF